MNCRERVLTTLNHDEPDKVPYAEHVIMQPELAAKMGMSAGGVPLDLGRITSFIGNIKGLPKRINKVLPRVLNNPKMIKHILQAVMKDYFKFYEKLKVDLGVFPIGPYTYYRYVPPNFVINSFGNMYELKTLGGVPSVYYHGGYFKNKEDYFNYPKPSPSEPFGKNIFKLFKKTISDDQIYVIPGVFNGIFDSTWQAFGMELFSKLLIKDTNFIKRIVRDREIYYRELAKSVIDEFNSEVFFLGDDLAYNSGPFISPRYFNTIFLPAYKRITNTLHKRGVKVIFHTDGDINPLMEGLADCFDSIHPFQASANMDIFQVKKDYGEKICVEGNVPIPMLVHGTQKEIAEYVKRLLKECAPGGGYMLSSGNSIVPEIPWKNYLTMLSTFWKYREYPIHIS